MFEKNGPFLNRTLFWITVIVYSNLIDHKTRYGIDKSCWILEFSELIFEPVTIWMNFPSVFHVIWTYYGIHAPEPVD